MKLLRLVLFFALAVPGMSHSETEVDQLAGVGDSCIRTQEPRACMEGYGFRCDLIGLPGRSVGAFALGCNAALSDGRFHFVQIFYADDGWNVEVENTYLPDTVGQDEAVEDPYSILSSHIREEMGSYRIQSSGYANSESLGEPLYAEIGTRRQGEQIDMRAVCGVIMDGEPNEAVSVWTKSACEKKILRAIMMLSQPQNTSPYHAAGAGEIEWQSRTATLVSSDIALVVEGRYAFPKNHTPCRWMSDCCLGHGPAYLDSCRTPTEIEMHAVKSCLAEGRRRRSEGFSDCLRVAGVKIGCDEQADGSRICY